LSFSIVYLQFRIVKLNESYIHEIYLNKKGAVQIAPFSLIFSVNLTKFFAISQENKRDYCEPNA
jgi:hypothetical protein